MSKAVLDTDIFSEVLRAVNVTVIGHAQTYRQAHGRLTLSVITVMEMVKGFQKIQRPQKMLSLLTQCQLRGSPRIRSGGGRACGPHLGRPRAHRSAYWTRRSYDRGGSPPPWPGSGHRQHVPLPANPTTRLCANAGELASVIRLVGACGSLESGPGLLGRHDQYF